MANGELSPEALELSEGTAGAVDPDAAAGVLVGRRGAVGRRGGVERRAGVPQAGVAQRGDHDRRDGRRSSGRTFLGISIIASHLKPYRGELDPTGIALMAQHIYGGTGVLFWITQIATFAILILAANTAYADFPRLASIIGRDGFIPRQFANRGDRLVYSNGIVFLSLVASVLIVAFDGNVSKLIPLYAFGVFTGFTLSQAGMVRHHHRLREDGWKWKLAINAVGAVTTGVIAAVVVISKFTQGAWIPAVVIPLLVLLFRSIKRHYARLGAGAADRRRRPPAAHARTRWSCSSAACIAARSPVSSSPSRCNPDHLLAVHICETEEDGEAFAERWAEFEPDVELDVVVDPYRNLRGTVLRYVEQVEQRWDDDRITVVIPEFVVHRWWEHLLHNQAALFLKGAAAVPRERRRRLGAVPGGSLALRRPARSACR